MRSLQVCTDKTNFNWDMFSFLSMLHLSVTIYNLDPTIICRRYRFALVEKSNCNRVQQQSLRSMCCEIVKRKINNKNVPLNPCECASEVYYIEDYTPHYCIIPADRSERVRKSTAPGLAGLSFMHARKNTYTCRMSEISQLAIHSPRWTCGSHVWINLITESRWYRSAHEKVFILWILTNKSILN